MIKANLADRSEGRESNSAGNPQSVAAANEDRTPRPLVLVTGSAGLIGSRLVERLAEAYRVIGLDVKPPMEDVEQAEWRECDLTDDDSVEHVFKHLAESHGQQIASVVHLAAYYDFSGEPSPLYEELTVEGTRRLLRQLQRFQVEQLIFSSSLLVMEAADEGEILTERSPTEGTWDYPQSKLEAEGVIRYERGAVPALILRIAGVYDERCHSVPIAQQISRIYEKKLESFFFPGDASHGQAFIHLDDLIECFAAAIGQRQRLPPFEVLLVAEPDVMSYGELQDRIGELVHGRQWPTIRIPKAVAKAGAWVQDKMAGEGEESFIKPWMIDLADTHYPVEITKARTLLEWEPQHRLRTTLEPMIRYLQADPDGWYKANGLPLPDELNEEES